LSEKEKQNKPKHTANNHILMKLAGGSSAGSLYADASGRNGTETSACDNTVDEETAVYVNCDIATVTLQL
jgi:hypothetical protein